MVATGGGQLEAAAILKPLVAQLVEAGRANHEPLGGGEGIERAVVEGSEDLLDIETGDAVSELLFFIAARVANWGGWPQAPEGYCIGALVGRGQRRRKSGLRKDGSRLVGPTTERL